MCIFKRGNTPPPPKTGNLRTLIWHPQLSGSHQLHSPPCQLHLAGQACRRTHFFAHVHRIRRCLAKTSSMHWQSHPLLLMPQGGGGSKVLGRLIIRTLLTCTTPRGIHYQPPLLTQGGFGRQRHRLRHSLSCLRHSHDGRVSSLSDHPPLKCTQHHGLPAGPGRAGRLGRPREGERKCAQESDVVK